MPTNSTSGGSGTRQPVMASKIHVPLAPLLIRPRLNDSLDRLKDRRLGLVVAPAGSKRPRCSCSSLWRPRCRSRGAGSKCRSDMPRRSWTTLVRPLPRRWAALPSTPASKASCRGSRAPGSTGCCSSTTSTCWRAVRPSRHSSGWWTAPRRRCRCWPRRAAHPGSTSRVSRSRASSWRSPPSTCGSGPGRSNASSGTSTRNRCPRGLGRPHPAD